MPRRLGPRAAVTGGLLVVLALPTAAVAGTLSHTDPAKDAQKITDSGSSTTITAAPDNETADIVHLGATYGPRRLKETLRLRDLGPRWSLRARITTATRRHFDVVLTHRPGPDRLTLTRGKAQTPIVCDGLVAAVDRPHHTASVTVPADCLVSPPWVRIGTGIVARGIAKGVSFGDDALRRRGIAEADLTLSRKLHQT